jgi:DNA-binding transcriptional LysR family regulator
MITLQKLRYVIEIVECGSFNEAARRLFISQPSLSGAVRELEQLIGFEIFLRTGKGAVLSPQGADFLGYARQVVEQADLMEMRYFSRRPSRQRFSVSTQHYAFVVKAFVRLVEECGADEYEFTFRDTRTHEILEDVRTLRSEIGVIYLNDFNRKVVGSLVSKGGMEFHPLLDAQPHVFVGAMSPLAARRQVTLEDLEDYPCLVFEQGEYNSFYFSEEILSTLPRKKLIRVSDRATIFNLMIGLQGYTISTGILNADLNGSDIVAVPLKVDERICVGWIAHRNVMRSRLAERFIDALKDAVGRGEDP